MKAQTKPEYCPYTEAQVRESGLLPPERMKQVEADITARIRPCFDAGGNEIPNTRIADLGDQGREVFTRLDSDYNVEYLRRTVMAAVLTAEEIMLIQRSCLDAIEEARNKDRFAKAEKLAAWAGGVFMDDTYFPSLNHLRDHLANEGDEAPAYVWAAEPLTVIPKLEVADVVECPLAENGWEDMGVDDLEGVSELQAALDQFTKANAGVRSYRPDYTKAILLAPPKPV
ncbi:MAG: hypothetical protein PHE83_16735 [Opitutaceae bacterium]|nr:hypothetical protein [Opitutaceae bacterium]